MMLEECMYGWWMDNEIGGWMDNEMSGWVDG